jgi:hypothetical protein
VLSPHTSRSTRSGTCQLPPEVAAPTHPKTTHRRGRCCQCGGHGDRKQQEQGVAQPGQRALLWAGSGFIATSQTTDGRIESARCLLRAIEHNCLNSRSANAHCAPAML